MVFVDTGTLSNAQNLREPIKSLCAAIGIDGAIQLREEFSDGFSNTRVVLGEHRASPDAAQPYNFVFKVGAANLLRDEVRRYLDFTANAPAIAVFVPISHPDATLKVLPSDTSLAAIAYANASDVFGTDGCISFKSLFHDCVIGERPLAAAESVIDSLTRSLSSLYSQPTRHFAHEITSYYLDHWAPDFVVAADQLVEAEDHLLLTLRRLNPNHFRRECRNNVAELRQEAELPPDGRFSDIALSTCTVAAVGHERVNVVVNSAEDLALHVDGRDLPPGCLANICKGSKIAIWAPRKVSRYEHYARHVQLALPSLDLAAPSFKAGPLWVHNPLIHLSRPLVAATKPPGFTWVAPGHGDLHPGNVLVAGASPAIIDYGKSTTKIPIGVDAARFFGGLVRDVVATLFSLDDIALVLAEALGLGSFNPDTNSPAWRAAHLLKLLLKKMIPASAPDSQALWPIHLYGYAWIGLKWPESRPESFGACFLLAGLALQQLIGDVPVPEDDGRSETGLLLPTTTKSITPEGPAEILILVTRFAGSGDYDPTTRIYSTLADHVFEIIPGLGRVERIDEVVATRKEAVAIAQQHCASMVVWGTFDNLGVSPHYEITRDSVLVKRSMIQLDQATRHKLSERFEAYVTENLASEISFLSLMAVAGMCELNLNIHAAINIYKLALSLIPDRQRSITLGAADIHRSIAALYFALGRDEEALEANGRALDLVPSDLGTELQRLQIRSRLDKKSIPERVLELKSLLRKQLDANEDDEEIADVLKDVLQKLEGLRTAGDLHKLIDVEMPPSPMTKQYKKDVVTHLKRAEQFSTVGDYKKSLAEVRAALRINPRCADALVTRANVFAVTDRVDDALKDLEKAEKINPKLPYIYVIRSNIFFYASDFPRAVHQLEVAFELGIPKMTSIFEWGAAMVEIGRGEEAMQSGRDWDIDPTNADFYAFRSYYYRKKGEYEIALREADQAIQLAKNDAQKCTSFIEQAKIHEAMMQPELAIADLEDGFKYAPVGTFTRRVMQQQMEELSGAHRGGQALKI